MTKHHTDYELARELVEAWRTGELMSAEVACQLAPVDDAGAWPIQHAVAQTLGWYDTRPTVWKLGGDHERLTAAPVAAARCHQNPHTLAANDLLCIAGFELEIAVRLGRDITPNAEDADIAAAIDAVMPAFEICEVRATGWPELPSTFHLADQQMNHALVLGAPVPGPWQPSWAETTPSLTVNETGIAPNAAHPLSHPLAALGWLARHVEQHFGAGLQAGDLISTGSWTGLYEAARGNTLVGRFAGLGEVRCRIE